MGQSEVGDFSKGLEQLAKLGLPAMEGAEWVKSPSNSNQTFTDSYEFRDVGVNISGSVWKLATDPPSYIEFGSAETIDLPEPEATDDSGSGSDDEPGLLGKMLRGYQEKNPEPEKAPNPKPKISKATKDAEKIATSLAKPSVAEELNSNINWGNSQLHGRLMLFAAQLHAAGETDSANKLAAALFNAVNEDTALIDGAISHLADTIYAATAESFFENTDWDNYLSECTALLEKFPRGWANAPAVALLVSKLEKRTDTQTTPSLPGITLNPEAILLLDKLLEKTETVTDINALAAAQGININDYPPEMRSEIIAMLSQRGMGGFSQEHGIWLLPAEEADQSPDNTPAGKLKALRMDGLIALAAVTTDETLVPARHTSRRSSYYSSNESAAEQIRKRYQSLARPTTRGEIAVSLLTSVIPTPENRYGSSDETDPAALSQEAIAFWKSNKDKSPVELATLYMMEGNSSQQSQATTFLTSSSDPSAHTAFEKAVLASPDPISLAPHVEAYLDTRKAAAKPFASDYIALLRENPPSDEELERTTGGYHIRDAGGVENFIKKLSVKIGDVSLEKMITEALEASSESGESKEGEMTPLAALNSTIETIPLEDCLLAFGKAAPLASPEQWMEIHQLLLQRISEESYSENETNITFSEDIIQTWRPLVARTENFPEKGYFTTYARGFGAKNTGELSMIMLVLAADPEITYEVGNLIHIESDTAVIMDIFRSRLTAIFSGEDPEPLPSVENVSDERSAEISESLASLSASEIIPFANKLSRDERLFMMSKILEYNQTSSTPQGILDLRTTISSTEPYAASDHDAETAALLGIKPGDKITPDFIESISDRLLKQPETFSTTTVIFYPGAMYLGTALYVTTVKDLDPQRIQSTGLSYMLRGMKQTGDFPAYCNRAIGNNFFVKTIEDGKIVATESKTTLAETLNASLESKKAVLNQIRISILTREDLEKISNQE